MAQTIGDLIINLVFGNDAGIRRDLVGTATKAGDAGGVAASKSFGDRFKAGLTRQNLGKGFMQGLGLGAGLGAVTAVASAVRLVTDAVGGSIDASIKWESAMAGVSKTLDTTGLSSADAAKALQDIEDGLRDMAKAIPLPVEQLAALAEAGGALGIARDDLMAFVRTSALLGTTTDIAAEDAATALGKINAVMPLTREEYSRFAATLVDLGNKGASTESEIVSMAQNMAGAASLIGMSHDTLLGWASALANAGEEAEAGGSSFQNFALKVNSAVASGSNKLAAFAKTAGMTAEEFKSLWGTDSSEALRRVVEGLAAMDKGARQATLSALGMKDIRITRALLSLTANMDNLNQSLATGEGAWDDNSAAAIEAEKRYGTTESKLALLNNRLHDFAIMAGDALVNLGTFLGDLVNAVNRGVDPTNSAIADTREQVRLLAREYGIAEEAALAAYDADVKRQQLTLANLDAIGVFQQDLRAAEFTNIQDALEAVNTGLHITTGGFDDLIARIVAMGDPGAVGALEAMRQGMGLTAVQATALGKAIEQVREDSVVILTEAMRDLAVESGRPLAQVLTDARVAMMDLGIETDDLTGLTVALRTQYGLIGPASEKAAEDQARAMEFIQGLLDAQDHVAGVNWSQRFWTGVRTGITKGAAQLADDPALIAEWEKAGTGFAFDLTGGFEKGVKDSRTTLKEATLALRDALDFDWAAEAGYAIGGQFGKNLAKGLRSNDESVVADAQALGLGALTALANAGSSGPRAAQQIGLILAELYGSGMEMGEVLVKLEAAGVNLTALEAIAAKAGWHRAGEGVAATWIKGVVDQKPEALEAGLELNAASLRAIARQHGWRPGGKTTAREWVQGLLEKKREARAAGGDLNDAGQTSANDTSGWGPGGGRVAGAWITGFKNALAAALAAGGTIHEQLVNVQALFWGASPPKRGPLRHIDVGGANVGSAWREAFLESIGISDRDFAGAFGGLTGLGGLSLPPITFNGQMTGLDTHGSVSQTSAMLGPSSTVNHGPTYNVNVQGLIRAETPADIGRALQRVGRMGNGPVVK